MGAPAPKPENYDELVAAWNDPAAWARECAKYSHQLRTNDDTARDITEPIRAKEDE